MASASEADAFGALVVVVGFANQIAELLELPEEIVERLFGHARAGRELQRTLVLGSRVLKNVQVRCDEVGEAARVQAGEHPIAHGLERDAQERADQRRRDGSPYGSLCVRLSKTT